MLHLQGQWHTTNGSGEIVQQSVCGATPSTREHWYLMAFLLRGGHGAKLGQQHGALRRHEAGGSGGARSRGEPAKPHSPSLFVE